MREIKIAIVRRRSLGLAAQAVKGGGLTLAVANRRSLLPFGRGERVILLQFCAAPIFQRFRMTF